MNNVFNCPHCQEYVFIEEINCGIFRHGFYKTTLMQIPPHLPKVECDQLAGLIYGCGKPFKIENSKIEECDYI